VKLSAQTTVFESLETLIGRLPDPRTDREALTVLCGREHSDVRRLAKRVQGRRELYRQSFRELFPGMDLVRSPLAETLSDRAKNCLAVAGIESWRGLAATTPITLRHVPNAGAGTVEEILLLAMAKWASEFLPESRQPNLPPGAAADPLLDLIGRAPDPAGDAPTLQTLLDPADSALQRFSERLCHDHWREQPLRELLPGLDLVDASAFSDHLDVRAANALGRVDLRGLSEVAGMTPAQIADLPRIGTRTTQLILTATIREWAAAYLEMKDGTASADRPIGGERPSKRLGLGGLATAFERLEGMAAFDTFRQRRLDDHPPSVRTLAARLSVSTQLIYEREARIERVLASGMRDDDWPIRIAVEEMRTWLGSVARPQDLDDAQAAIGIDSRALPSHLPHRLSLLLRLGGYRVTREWILDRDIEALTGAVLAVALSNYSGDLDAVGRRLSLLGVREELQLPWLASRHGFKIVDGRLVALT
jgi:hypothetical protein